MQDKHIPTQAFLDRIAYIRKLKTERRRMGTELDNLKIEFLLTKAEEGLEAIKQKMNRDPKEIQTPEGA